MTHREYPSLVSCTTKRYVELEEERVSLVLLLKTILFKGGRLSGNGM